MELKLKLTSFRTFLVEGVIHFFGVHLPRRMKRMILLASVSGRLKEPSSFNNETLAKLNRVMEMSKRDDAIMYPVYLSQAIWYGKTSREIIEDEPSTLTGNEDRILRAAKRIFDLSPLWLRYGPEDEVMPDLIKLLRIQPSVLS